MNKSCKYRLYCAFLEISLPDGEKQVLNQVQVQGLDVVTLLKLGNRLEGMELHPDLRRNRRFCIPFVLAAMEKHVDLITDIATIRTPPADYLFMSCCFSLELVDISPNL